MKVFRLAWMLILVGLLVLPTGLALASSGANPLDRIIAGDDYLLDEGEREDGDVAVLGGSVEIRQGATLDGDLAVLGGDVKVGGYITGDVVVLGGDVDILAQAHIEGDCVFFGGDVSTADGAQIDGDMVTDPERRWFFFDRGEIDGDRLPGILETPERSVVPELPGEPQRPAVVYRHGTSVAGQIWSAFLSAIAAGIVAMLITLFVPRHTDQVRQVVVREPVMSGLIGFLTFVAAVLLTPILAVISTVLVFVCIGLLGFPLIMFMWLLVVAAFFLGWTAIGQLAGRWLRGRLRLHGTTPALEAGLGAFAVSLVLGLVQAIGCVVGFVGGLLSFAIFCLGVGAVVLTRFGRQDYHSGQRILPARPSPRKPAAAPAAPAVPEPTTPDDPELPEGDAIDTGDSEPPLDFEGPFPQR